MRKPRSIIRAGAFAKWWRRRESHSRPKKRRSQCTTSLFRLTSRTAGDGSDSHPGSQLCLNSNYQSLILLEGNHHFLLRRPTGNQVDSGVRVLKLVKQRPAAEQLGGMPQCCFWHLNFCPVFYERRSSSACNSRPCNPVESKTPPCRVFG